MHHCETQSVAYTHVTICNIAEQLLQIQFFILKRVILCGRLYVLWKLYQLVYQLSSAECNRKSKYSRFKMQGLLFLSRKTDWGVNPPHFHSHYPESSLSRIQLPGHCYLEDTFLKLKIQPHSNSKEEKIEDIQWKISTLNDIANPKIKILNTNGKRILYVKKDKYNQELEYNFI